MVNKSQASSTPIATCERSLSSPTSSTMLKVSSVKSMKPNIHVPSSQANEELRTETTVTSNLDVGEPIHTKQLSIPQNINREDSYRVDDDVSNYCHVLCRVASCSGIIWSIISFR